MNEYNDDDFWNARPELTYIYDYARACQVAPWALLFITLARVSVAVPPHVVTPGFQQIPKQCGRAPVINPGTLNLFVAVLGNSGDGKGLTERVARSLVPDIRDAITAIPASGEGIPALFAAREMCDADDKKSSVLVCRSPRALLSVPEVATLGGSSKRVGSILIPTLTSAYSGEALGVFNKNEMNRIAVPEFGYRLALVTGVQPANLHMIMNEAGTGLPQRFLWADAGDVDAPNPEDVPPLPSGPSPFESLKLPGDMSIGAMNILYEAGDRWKMIDHGEANYPLTVLHYPQIAYDEVKKSGTRRLHREDDDPLNSHRIGLVVRVSALLSFLAQREEQLTVTEEDWNLAEYVYQRSAGFRKQAVWQAEEIKNTILADKYERNDRAKAEVQQRKKERVQKNVLNYLFRHDPGCEGVKGYTIKQAMGRDKDEVYEVIDSLYAEGLLDRLDSVEKTSSALWALSCRACKERSMS